jgi:hypothetical protein
LGEVADIGRTDRSPRRARCHGVEALRALAARSQATFRSNSPPSSSW